MISDSHKFIFIHIPKTAGTSLCNIFLKEKAYIHTKKGRYYQSHESVNDLEITNSEEMDKYFTFSFVRNPFRRLVSYYNFKINTKYFPPKISFKEMCRKIYKKERKGIRDRNFLLHTRSCCEYLINKNGEINIDFIGKVENLQKDFDFICDKINLQKQIIPKQNKSKVVDYTDFYDNETIKITSDIYQSDLEKFSYKFGE